MPLDRIITVRVFAIDTNGKVNTQDYTDHRLWTAREDILGSFEVTSLGGGTTSHTNADFRIRWRDDLARIGVNALAVFDEYDRRYLVQSRTATDRRRYLTLHCES